MDVGVFVVDGVADFGLAAVLEVLGTANSLRAEMPAPPPPWTITTLGTTSRVRTGAGHLVPATRLDELAGPPELLIVPASNVKEAGGLTDTVCSAQNAPALEMIAEAGRRGVPLAAACTGTFFLAEAGVLDGCSATTSWWLGPVFRARYPRVRLDESRTLCRDGEITTAGAAFAHVDLALSLVQSRSPALAELVARYLLIGNRAAQADFAIPAVLAKADPALASLERWVREHLAESISIAAAARELGLSERGLQRSTAATLGMSPLEFITEIRIAHATFLLRTTALSTDVIAGRVGYLNGSTLRDVVRRRRGMTLRQLREGPTPVRLRQADPADVADPAEVADPAGHPEPTGPPRESYPPAADGRPPTPAASPGAE